VTVAALHGFTGAPESFDACAPGALAPALVGHAGRAPDGGASPFAAEVERIAGAIAGAVPVHLVGYSMGARVALGVALAHPQRVRRLTLIGVNPGLETGEDRRARGELEASWIRVLERDGIEAFVDLWERLPLWRSQEALPAAVRRAQRARRLAHDPAGLAGALRTLGLAVMPNFWPRLGELRMPVDLVAGELDDRFRALAGAMRPRLGAGRLIVVPGCGHNPVLERPRAIAALLVEDPPAEDRPPARRIGGREG
jgi:2-succinyl-6-hydroxy-2,4-cyclohexadiene-1-carboxylate synthase